MFIGILYLLVGSYAFQCVHVFAGLYVYLNMFLHGYGCVCARVTVSDKAEGGMGIHF